MDATWFGLQFTETHPVKDFRGRLVRTEPVVETGKDLRWQIARNGDGMVFRFKTAADAAKSLLGLDSDRLFNQSFWRFRLASSSPAGS